MTLDLEKPGAAKLLAKSVLADIDAAAVELYDDGHRRHLGASKIGEPCSRALWYSFRWAYRKIFDGRQQRLFNRGHKEESRFNEWLTHKGYRVLSVDPATGEQWRISGVGGHFGGSCDGIAYLPPKYEYDKPLLLEFKTNATGAGFSKLLENGCGVAKPVHYDQQHVYGYKLGLDYSLYLNVCKNDDNIHSEILKLNHARGKDLEKKAEVIILAQEPPKRISEQAAYSVCNYCDFKKICHEGLPLERNCRSCKNASPIDNKQWRCAYWGNTIPPDFIPTGCDHWEPIA